MRRDGGLIKREARTQACRLVNAIDPTDRNPETVAPVERLKELFPAAAGGRSVQAPNERLPDIMPGLDPGAVWDHLCEPVLEVVCAVIRFRNAAIGIADGRLAFVGPAG